MSKYILFIVCTILQAGATFSILGAWYFLTKTDVLEMGLMLSVLGAFLYAIIELISQAAQWNRRQELGFQLLFLVIFSDVGLRFISIHPDQHDTLLLINVTLMLISITSGYLGKKLMQY